MHRTTQTLVLATSLSLLLIFSAQAASLQVGPNRALKRPSDAAKIAKDGDTVIIDAGEYFEDVTIWRQNRLTLHGTGGTAHLKTNGKTAERKAIWVVKGNDVVVENLEFSGARAPDRNGAGIRFEGANLTIRNSHFHDNEMGLLTGANPFSTILIEGSEFNDNTVDYRRYGKLGHNIYIGAIRRFILRNSYIHDANIGHDVKSRARENFILYNRISDERNASSYLVDLPDGGTSYLIGNLLRQSPHSENGILLSFAAEHHQTDTRQTLYVVNNTFVNDRRGGSFVNNHGIRPAILINNLLVGNATRLQGSIKQKSNLVVSDGGFKDRERFDYRLGRASVAIDRGVDPGVDAGGVSLRPKYQYRHPRLLEKRPQHGAIDVGAYEFDVRLQDSQSINLLLQPAQASLAKARLSAQNIFGD